MNKKIIYTAIAIPGSGKTKAALAAIPGMLSLGKKVLFVAPTFALADQVFDDISNISSSIKPIKVDSRNGVMAEATLNKMLNPKESKYFIICQHASFQKCSTTYLGSWTIIIDELPMPINLRHATFDNTQLRRLELVENIGGQLQIKNNMQEPIKNEINTFNKDNGMYNNKINSTLAASTHDIYKAIVNKTPVFVDTTQNKNGESNSNKDNPKTIIRIIEEYGFFERFHAAREVHLLSATLDGSLFDWFARANGFTYEKSSFAPNNVKNCKDVTIYPMLSDDNYCSRGVLDSVDATSDEGHKTLYSITKLIDSHLGDEQKCLMFSYNWGQQAHGNKFTQCKIDSRGLNNFSHTHNAFMIFHGNPTPIARRSLEFIAQKYNGSIAELERAWKFTHKLEMTLQNAFRTSLRNKETNEPVNLYVQDSETAQFFQNTYLPDAILDDSLAKTYKVKKIPGPAPHPAKDRALELLKAGMKQVDVARITGLNKMTISNYAKTLRPTITSTSNSKSLNTLEEWL
ncbi:DEAD/DEAH box helicase [Pseudomonas sp. PD9R]|uniref:DEAD/DEAH box helicase n=1 Tax=Pseudomonas sp. PD9R TaxID=2853534 RepID=UPI001C4404D5|nr:DEAD/DEAH box helicase [Pseudomonas sp. PD9R]MBV6821454.1 DEAD/DEAH box helicase [Pseudomonas sp. PD9R]